MTTPNDTSKTAIRIVEFIVASPSSLAPERTEQRRNEATRALEIAFDRNEELISVTPVAGHDFALIVYTFRGRHDA